jgi:patatin-like phospholipase/acyl hydrolase
VRVLSIDGGGIRGVIPAMVLQRLEELAQRPICDLFDLIAGTSTGGILALALTCPDPRNKTRPVYTATDALHVYLDRGNEIFSNSTPRPRAAPGSAGAAAQQQQAESSGGLSKIFSGAKILSGPKYNAKNLERVLGEYMGSSLLRESLTPLLITSYDLERRMPFFFKTRLALGQPDHNYEMRHVGRATSAAPLYFPPAKLTDPHTGGHVGGYKLSVGFFFFFFFFFLLFFF